MKTFLNVLITIVVLVGAIWFVFRGTSIEESWSFIQSAKISPLLLTIPLILLSHAVRSYRWTYILRPSVGSVKQYPAFSAVMIGYASSMIIPRSGELLRPWILARSIGKDYSAVLSSVLFERIVDVLSLLCVIGICVVLKQGLFGSALPGFNRNTIILAFILPSVILVGLLWLITYTSVANTLALRLRHRWQRSGSAVVSLVHSIQNSVRAFVKPSTWPVLVITSAAIWLLYMLPVQLVLSSLQWPGSEYMTFADTLIVLVSIAAAVTVAPTPGALGLYQLFAQTALTSVAGAPANVAAAFGFLAWMLNYGVAFFIGALCYAIEVYNNPMLSYKNAKLDLGVRPESQRS